MTQAFRFSSHQIAPGACESPPSVAESIGVEIAPPEGPILRHFLASETPQIARHIRLIGRLCEGSGNGASILSFG